MIAAIVVGIICGMIIYQMYNKDEVIVAFLDVGQGDAILISKGSQQILIDGGPDGTVLMERLGKYIPFWDKNIEIVIATHPDGDHIDGLISIFENYSVDQFWHTEASKDTSISTKLFQSAKKEKELKDITAFNGLGMSMEGVNLSVIYPFNERVGDVEDINNVSIALILQISDEFFYLGGDLSSDIEDILPIDDTITVLKASHHGSASSTSETFLEKVNPRDVIISAGRENRYGHPHEDVLNRILDVSAHIFRTDKLGDIVYICNDDCTISVR